MLDAAEVLFRNGMVELLRFLPNKRRAPSVCPELAVEVIAGADHGFIHPLLVANGFDGVVGGIVQMSHAGGQISKPLPRFGGCRKETPVSDLLRLVHLFESAANLLVVAFDGRKRLIGDSLGKQSGCGAEQAVADADVVIEERERLAGFDGFKPKADAAKFGGHGVDVYSVEAVADDIAQGVLVVERRGFAFTLCLGTDIGQMLGQPVRRADQEVAGADGRIADLESQDCLFGFRGRLALDGLFDDGVERRVQQALHERVGRVVGAGGLALIAGDSAEGEDAGGEFHGGVEFEQALVDAAQFLAAQVAVVHQPPAAAVFDEPEIAYRQEQVLIGEFGGFEIGHGLRAKEESRPEPGDQAQGNRNHRPAWQRPGAALPIDQRGGCRECAPPSAAGAGHYKSEHTVTGHHRMRRGSGASPCLRPQRGRSAGRQAGATAGRSPAFATRRPGGDRARVWFALWAMNPVPRFSSAF